MKRRDFLRQIETEVQEWWEEEGIFQADPDPSRESFFINFPFPYMNGRLHLGHAYSLTKCDFIASFQRLLGKNVLFPFAFHCTGMPIQGAATKLRRELEKYGCPPREEAGEVDEKAEQKNDGSVNKARGNKTKLKAKTGGAKLQWDIMRMLGIPEEDIPKFQEPSHWLHYFTPLGEQDLREFGLSCDWRRSFMTTSENRFFDRFVRWQFYKLKEKRKVEFGQRPTIYSPLDKQACADHDRASGEGILPQEYTLIKLQVLNTEENYDKIPQALLLEHKVFLVAATLRPETMYGQTNCFILPDGEYLAVKVKSGEVFICSERSAKNMSFQDLTPSFGKVDVVTKFKGRTLVGLALDAPRTPYEKIYTLPLLTISMKKGTGVVTSVPSDAPDDYAALMDWKNDAKLREKFHVKKEWVDPYEVIPIIEIPGLGSQAAVTLCQKYKVKSQKDKQKLADIKAEVYKKGFYEGIMIVGDDNIKGKKVCDVKDFAKAQMVKENLAVVYYEPEGEVKSRSGDDCVVTYLDQWYLKYGEEDWKEKVKAHVNSASFSAYNSANLKQFNDTLDWLGEWACSRSFGLGTKLPWDEKFVIESLSDSTIYMAYYTIAHKLQGRKNHSFTGAFGSPIGLDLDKADELITNHLFDYIYLGKKWPKFYEEGDTISATLGLSFDEVDSLRQEFEYWYPFNLRSSGKELIKNHLTMCLYNHAAIWDDRPDLWPRTFFTNGHVQVDAMKMSKSAGNFIMLHDAVSGNKEAVIGGKKVIVGWGADATRFACADAGDTLEDSNFSCDTANSIILRLTNELDFMRSVFHFDETNPEATQASDSFVKLRVCSKTEYNFHDHSFLNKMNHNVTEAKSSRDTYRDACLKLGIEMEETLIKQFVVNQLIVLSPVCRHFCEYAWRKILRREGSVTLQSWPHVEQVDVRLMRISEFVEGLIQGARKKLMELQGKRTKRAGGSSQQATTTQEKHLAVYLSEEFPGWKQILLGFAAELYDASTRKPRQDAMKLLKKFCVDHPELKKMMKKAMQVGAFILKQSESEYERAFEKGLMFNQQEVLEDNMDYIARAIGIEKVTLHSVDSILQDVESHSKAEVVAANEAEPGVPAYMFCE